MPKELTVPVEVKKATIEKMSINMVLEIGGKGTAQQRVVQKSFEVEVNPPITLI
jgi:hypothetical protein